MANKLMKGEMGALIAGIITLLVGTTNLFGMFDIGAIGAGIVIAAGTLVTVAAVAGMLKLKAMMGGLLVGVLTIIVGTTSFFGLVELGDIGTGIVVGFGVLAILGGLLGKKIGL